MATINANPLNDSLPRTFKLRECTVPEAPQKSIETRLLFFQSKPNRIARTRTECFLRIESCEERTPQREHLELAANYTSRGFAVRILLRSIWLREDSGSPIRFLELPNFTANERELMTRRELMSPSFSSKTRNKTIANGSCVNRALLRRA